MAITQAMPTSFKVEILQAVHNFGPTSGNTFKIALYTSSATLSAATTVYSSSNEVSSTKYTDCFCHSNFYWNHSIYFVYLPVNLVRRIVHGSWGFDLQLYAG